jgi:hypothetical protein
MHSIKNLFPAIALLTFSGICTANSFDNGGFEAGLTGWVMSGDSSYTSTQNAFPHSGDSEAHIGAYGDAGNGYLTQTFATTAGADYTLSFWYGEYNQNDPQLPPYGYLLPGNVNTTDSDNPYFQANNLTVQWNGVDVFADSNFFASDQGLVSQGQGFYQQVSFTVQATGDSSALSFGAFDRQQDVVLDDVVVTAQTPEPATLGLIGSALVGLGLLRRKRISGANRS